MTTNVFDGDLGLIATDSRWSIQYGRWLRYVDDTNFDKIEVFGDKALMFAGKGYLIEQWKLWIRSNPADDSGQPEVEGISINGFDVPTKTKRYSEGMSIAHESSIFAGSGARHAVVCWVSNRDAKKSVETAKGFDPATGGSVKFFNFSDRKHNLGNALFAPGTIGEVDSAILSRGIIMDISTAQRGGMIPFKLSDVAASAEGADELNEMQAKIAAGELSAEAPCDAMYSKWTPEAKTELKHFLGEMFGWKK